MVRQDHERVGCVAVTGATGLVGRFLCEYFHARGWEVRALIRNPERSPFRESGISSHRCILPDEFAAAAFTGADVVIHCAYATRPTSLMEALRVNEEGTARVVEQCRAAAVRRFVFISSLSAHEQALSYYARSKLAIERTLDPRCDLIIRSGLVLAKIGDGLFNRMVSALYRSGIVPIFDGGRQIIQTVYVEDLCTAIHAAIVADSVGCYVVAEPEGMAVRDFFRLVAEKCGVRCRLISLPTAPLLFVLRILERLKIHLPISSENVLGVKSLRFEPSTADLKALGVTARSAEESIELIFSHPTR